MPLLCFEPPYLVNNEDILVNYGEKKVNNLPFSSNIAEYTVENLVNSRYRQTGKMQWKREGAHALLQPKLVLSHMMDNRKKIDIMT